MDKPMFVTRDNMSSDMDYISWLAEVKQRFNKAQAKAMVRVNTSMLELY